jgi:TolA-binding protein
LFQEGRTLVVQGEYEKAVPVLEDYIEKHPKGEHASRAGLFLGKALLGQGRLKDARDAFEAVVRDHPETLEGHKCRYKLAVVAMLLGDAQDAVRRFDALASRPDGPLAGEARAMKTFLEEERIG